MKFRFDMFFHKISFRSDSGIDTVKNKDGRNTVTFFVLPYSCTLYIRGKVRISLVRVQEKKKRYDDFDVISPT